MESFKVCSENLTAFSIIYSEEKGKKWELLSNQNI